MGSSVSGGTGGPGDPASGSGGGGGGLGGSGGAGGSGVVIVTFTTVPWLVTPTSQPTSRVRVGPPGKNYPLVSRHANTPLFVFVILSAAFDSH